MPRKSAPIPTDSQQPLLPGWEQLTQEQQQALIEVLKDAASELRDQYESELNRLEQSAAAGRMLSRVDGAGISRQPIPPLPDIKRDSAYEKLVLDIYRLAVSLSYVEACLAHLSAKGYDIGTEMASYLHARTEGLAEGRVKAFARTLEDGARASYTSLYSRIVQLFPELAMQRVGEWDESSRQQDSWLDRLRRLWGEH
jgi:hypothetical protein